MSKARKHEVWWPEESNLRYTQARIERSDAKIRSSLRDFVEWLSKVRGLMPSTVAARLASACVFVDAVARRLGGSCASSFRALTADGVEDFFIDYGKDHGPETRRSMQKAMRLFLRFAADRGWVDRDMVGSVPSLVSWRLSTLPRRLSEEEVSQLLASPFEDGRCPRRDWAILCLLATYGVRRGQVSALRLEDLDWQGRTLTFAAHKGGKTVRHSLVPAVAEALVAYLRDERPESEQGWIFLQQRPPHTRLSPGAITAIVKVRSARRGVGPISPHALRHTFASRLLRGGQSMKTIADLLGHRSLTSVGIYAKVDDSRLLEVAEEWPEVGS